MESADGDEHDSTHESAENVLNDDGKQIRDRGAAYWEGHDHDLCENGGSKSAHESPAPYSDRLVLFAPHAGIVSKCNFEGEVDQNGQRQVFLTEPLVQQFEVRDGVVCLETDLSDQVDDDEDLDVAELHDAAHDFVDVHDAVSFFCTIFTLEDGQTEGNGKIGPAPEDQVAVQSEETGLLRYTAEVLVGEVGAAESEEDSVAQELTSRESNSLRSGCVGQVGRREQSERPTVHSNILSGTQEDERKPPSGKAPDTCSTVRASFFHHLLRSRSQPNHAQPAQQLYRQNPTLSPSNLRTPHCVDDRAPKQLQAVRV